MIGSLFLTSLLYFVLLLSLCQVLCGKVYATNKSPPGVAATTTSKNNNNIELFKTGSIEVNFNSTGDTVTQSCNVNNYYSPVIVSAGDVIVALTGVNRTSDNSNDNNNVTIVTKYIEIEKKNEEDWGAQILTSSSSSSSSDNGKWKSQFAVQHKIGNIEGDTSVVKGMLAAAKNDKEIYVLLVNCSNKKNGDFNNDANCDFKITVGTVTGETNAKKITWADGKLEKTTNIEESVKTIKEEKLKLYPSGGTAFTTKDNKVVFVVIIANEKKKSVFVVIYSEGDKTETKFKVSKEENVDGCTLSFFPWRENKIIMIPTNCTEENKKNNPKVKESSDMGSKWSESTGPLARLLDFMQDKNDFTATTINDRNILLFTQQKEREPKINGKDKYDVHVWFTDGKRVHTLGRIVTDDNITSSNLLHTNGELFALHQNISNSKPETITLTRMKEQLNEITTVLVAWNTNDNVVEKMFKETFTSLSEGLEATNGLVGFLSNNGTSNKSWTDEYYYVNAIVKNGNKVTNGGFTFNGKNAGARWPVGKQKEDQPYNFTDLGFTLLANVTIDGGVGDKDNSVMGVGYNESDKTQKTVGLLCTQGGEWVVTGNGVASKNILGKRLKCQQGSAYLAALVLNTNKLSVYIDGEELNVKESKEIKIDKTHNITHFYFGTDESQNGVESHVTVRNVLLYNRPFSHEEVEKLRIIKQDKPSDSGDNSANHTDSQGRTQKDKEITGGSSGGNGDSSDTTDNDTKITDMTSSPSQPESSTLCGGLVGVLIISLLFGLHGCYLK